MNDIFLYVSTGLILFAYICYFLLIFYGKNKKICKDNSFDIIKDIIDEYNSINIIESKNYFTVYNIRRKVIKLSTGCYYGNDLGSISLALIEAGISVIDKKKNKYIDILRNIFSNLKLLYVFPIVALLISNSSFNVNDAKSSIVFVLIFAFLSYILLDIKGSSGDWISGNLKKIKILNKESSDEIIKFINKILFLDKIIYFGELIIVVRLAMIMI